MPRHMTEQKRTDIKEALADGMTGSDIRQLMNTSAETIIRIKRSMGIPVRSMKSPTRTRGPGRTVAPAAPTALPSPEEYVAAFEARVLEYRMVLAQKSSEIERLERENATLRSEYQQVAFRAANWTPSSIVGQSLGNGG
jgi:hypothetical protein